MFSTLNYHQRKEHYKFFTTETTEKMLSEENQITEKTIGCAIKVHSTLRPGLLESVDQGIKQVINN